MTPATTAPIGQVGSSEYHIYRTEHPPLGLYEAPNNMYQAQFTQSTRNVTMEYLGQIEELETPAEPTFYRHSYYRYNQIVRTWNSPYYEGVRFALILGTGWEDNPAFNIYHWYDNDDDFQVVTPENQIYRRLRNEEEFYTIESTGLLEYMENCKFGSFDEVIKGIPRERETRRAFRDAHRIASIWNIIRHERNKNFNKNNRIVSLAVQLFQPKKGEKPGTLSIYRNYKDMERGRRTELRVGRALRHMLPKVCDDTISAAAETYIEETSPRNFKLVTSFEADDFARAYGNDRAAYRNPATTVNRKSLATSCMQGVSRYDIDGKISVGRVYASGDFEIAYLTYKDDLIAARVVIGWKENEDGEKCAYHGPLYGCCEQSLDELQAYLDSINSTEDDGCYWGGLRLNVIRVGKHESLMGPYLDGEYSGEIDGDYIVLGDDGDLNFGRTDGLCSEDMVYCDHCGEPVHIDEARTGPNGETYCDYCFDELCAITEDGDVIWREDSVEAQMIGWQQREYTIIVHQDDAVYIEALDEYWCDGNVTWVEEKETYWPDHRLDELD